MSLSHPVQPIVEDDETIRAALESAFVPPLLPALAHLTGDLSLLRPELRPDPEGIRLEQGGLTPEQQQEARALALDVLVRYRDEGCPPAPALSHHDLQGLMEFTTGGAIDEGYIPFLEDELGADGVDRGAPTWTLDTVAPGRPFRVAVVGAGMSGILAAHRLRQAGLDVVVFEKNSDVGGTWLENTYPGCRVDVPNHVYSYSFARKDDWPHHFSTQAALLDYFRTCVDEFELSYCIRFDTEVVSAVFDEARATWTVNVRESNGREESVESHAVISAVGQLNRPNIPVIAGQETFAGPTFHSARWDREIDLRGKRVAVIGTGASAAQFIPIVADEASELRIFQRTAAWFAPTPEYHDEVPSGLQWLFGHVPFYSEWHRCWLFWRGAEGLLPYAEVDPDWALDGRSVSAANDELRALLTMYIEIQFPDDPELGAKVVPDYPPAAKRIIRDNGIWAATLQRDNVHLVTEGIAEITPAGITARDGEQHDADVIIYATGFTASHFLTPMRVVGRDGVDLHERWAGDARAYLGMTVPDFPNFFCLYGPNTNIVVNGSIIWFSECEVHYVLGCVRLLLERGDAALDCRVDVHDAYNVTIDEGNRRMAWGASTVNSWYKNERGRVAQNWPFSLLEFWERTRKPNPDDYEFLRAQTAEPAGTLPA